MKDIINVNSNEIHTIIHVKIQRRWDCIMIALGFLGLLFSPFYAQYQIYQEREFIDDQIKNYYFESPLCYLILVSILLLIVGIVLLIKRRNNDEKKDS